MVNRADEAATVAATQAASVRWIKIVSDRRRAHDPAFRARVLDVMGNNGLDAVAGDIERPGNITS